MDTRRDFCRAVLGAAGAAALPSSGCLAPRGDGQPTGAAEATAAAEALSLDAFSTYVGTPFRFANGDGTDTREVMLVRAADRASPAGRGACFELTFEAAATLARGAATLAQDTYQAVHDDLGSFPLFIVPVPTPGLLPVPGQAPAGPRYVAIFNRL